MEPDAGEALDIEDLRHHPPELLGLIYDESVSSPGDGRLTIDFQVRRPGNDRTVRLNLAVPIFKDVTEKSTIEEEVTDRAVIVEFFSFG